MLPTLNIIRIINTFLYYAIISLGFYSYYIVKQDGPEYEPTVSVIIPVHNDVEDIYNVINSHITTTYPHDKLEIFIANDSSSNKLVEEVKRAIMDFPHVYIQHMIIMKNGEKRHAFKKAFDESTGEVIVRCDGGTYVEKDSLGNLVRHLKEPEICCVTGVIRIKNWNKNLLTRIQSFRYNCGFQQLYSFSNLLTHARCFSAYNRSIIEGYISNRGNTNRSLSEDRDLAQFIIENGFKMYFVKDAFCYTEAPDTWSSYLKHRVL
jgi:cellulose synthase/poly-beta-1,6-N-acetylglucosamine synthase-like glycosyltransferase